MIEKYKTMFHIKITLLLVKSFFIARSLFLETLCMYAFRPFEI